MAERKAHFHWSRQRWHFPHGWPGLWLKALFFWGMIGILTACISASPVASLPKVMESPTAPSTPTPIWFPATPTFTPLPLRTATPTPDWFAQIRGVLLTDAFSDPQVWNLVRSSQGSVSLREGRLILAAQPAFTLVTLRREPILEDFYLEATAELSLCRGEDLYGLLFRATANGAYRYGLDCRGRIRLDRLKGNVRYELQSPLPSGDAPLGSPGIVRLGVWAQGRVLRFFLNSRYQFEVQDATLTNGLIGFFARPAGDTPLTVRFANLAIYSLQP